MTFHYYVISRRLLIHAHGNEYLGGMQLRSSYGRAATVGDVNNPLLQLYINEQLEPFIPI